MLARNNETTNNLILPIIVSKNKTLESINSILRKILIFILLFGFTLLISKYLLGTSISHPLIITTVILFTSIIIILLFTGLIINNYIEEGVVIFCEETITVNKGTQFEKYYIKDLMEFEISCNSYKGEVEVHLGFAYFNTGRNNYIKFICRNEKVELFFLISDRNEYIKLKKLIEYWHPGPPLVRVCNPDPKD